MVKTLPIVFVLLIGFSLRCGGLRYGLPSKNLALTTYHPDEAKSYYSLEKMKPSELNFHPGDGLFWGSLHLYALGFALQAAKIAGILQIPSRQFLIDNLEMADRLYILGRLLSVFFGVATLFILYLICRRLCRESFALLAALLLAISPVHIFNSFVVRPDIMMIFLAMVSFYFSLKILESDTRAYPVLAGFFCGLAAATKYNGGLFIFCPLFAQFLKFKGHVNFLWIIFFSFLGFVIGCPYALIDFEAFLECLSMNASLSRGGASAILYGPGWKSYMTVYFPHGLGWPITLLGCAGFVTLLIEVLKTKRVRISVPFLNEDVEGTAPSLSSLREGAEMNLSDKRKLVWLVSAVVLYLLSSLSRHQQVWYTLPVVPFFVAFAAYFLIQLLEFANKFPLRLSALRWLWSLFFIFILGYNSVYALAHLNLYRQKNVREMASEWLKKNVPKGEFIGIVRSYFWTPGILRQYHPPYRLIQGGDEQSFWDDAVLGLEQVKKKANIIVLTEFEYAPYLNPKLGKNSSKQAQLFKSIMENEEYREVSRFDNDPRFLWFAFPRKEDSPDDWFMPNPTIRIYKRAAGFGKRTF